MTPTKKPVNRIGPTSGSSNPAACDCTPNEADLAARLFVKFYEPGGGRKPEHHAQLAIDAAKVFVATYQQNHR